MGRRKRSRQDDDIDVLESYEREWLVQRENASKHRDVANDGGLKDSENNETIKESHEYVKTPPHDHVSYLSHEASYLHIIAILTFTFPDLTMHRREARQLQLLHPHQNRIKSNDSD